MNRTNLVARAMGAAQRHLSLSQNLQGQLEQLHELSSEVAQARSEAENAVSEAATAHEAGTLELQGTERGQLLQLATLYDDQFALRRFAAPTA